MAEVNTVADGEQIDYTPVVAVAAGQMLQLWDGRAAWAPDAIAAGVKGSVQVGGIVQVAKTATMVLLAGGRCYWDYSADKCHYMKVNDQDFYIGRVFADAASADTTAYVELNVDVRNDIDMTRDAFLSVPTGTKAAGAFGYPKTLGGANMLELTATSEAQCIDMLSVDRFAVAANAIAEFIVRVDVNGTDNTVDISLGVANGTSTTDADAITEHVLFHIDGGSTAINAQSKDGTTTVTATDTTKTFTAGTAVANRFELWIDTRVPGGVVLYVNGVRVLSGSTFDLSHATGPLGLLAHIEKTSGTATGRITVDAMRCRLMDQ